MGEEAWSSMQARVRGELQLNIVYHTHKGLHIIRWFLFSVQSTALNRASVPLQLFNHKESEVTGKVSSWMRTLLWHWAGIK